MKSHEITDMVRSHVEIEKDDNDHHRENPDEKANIHLDINSKSSSVEVTLHACVSKI